LISSGIKFLVFFEPTQVDPQERSRCFYLAISRIEKEIINDILIDEISPQLTTSCVASYIDNLREGNLTLIESQVSEFLSECKSLNIKSSKLELLKNEWNIY
jgi:hypothetical protein